MWSGGPDAIGSVRPAGKWAQGLTYQTAKAQPVIHNLSGLVFFFISNIHKGLALTFHHSTDF